MKGLLKQNKGITLMALVITIIVIVILVGITISAVIGDHGIITETKQAKDDYLESEAAEQSTLDSAVSAIRSAREEAGLPAGSGSSGSGSGNSGTGTNGTGPNGSTGGTTGGNYGSSRTPGDPVTFSQAISTSMFSKTVNSAYTDSTIQNNNVVTIPAGYRMTNDASTIDEGIVIEDASGNQWVWIPVDDPSEMYELLDTPTELGGPNGSGITTSYKSKTIILNRGDIGSTENVYREPEILTECDRQNNATYLAQAGFTDQPATETSPSKTAIRCFAEDLSYSYYDMIESVKYYGGFYLGRFELSGSVNSPTITKNQTVLIQKTWYEFYNACSKFTSSSAVSRMVWGCQWDEALKFITERGNGTRVSLSESTTYGNFTSTLRPTGYSETWKTHNIYDLSGNYFEETQEAYNIGSRVYRGRLCK